MRAFSQLDDYLAIPPLPAILAVLMVLGINYLGRSLARRFSGVDNRPIKTAAAFLVLTATIAALVNGLIIFKIAYWLLLRTMAWGLAALGVLEIWRARASFFVYGRKLRDIFSQQEFWGKTALVFMGLTLAGYFLAALAPAADADSLHYHLGAPLDMLRHHGFHPRPDWHHLRLIGLGEALNMLGLAGGTDILGAQLQFAGLLICLVAVVGAAQTVSDKLLFALLVLSCPALINLVLSQKPMMLPIAATTVAMLLIAEGFPAITPLTILISCICVFFAMACKYSFYFSGAIILAMGMYAARRAKMLRMAMVIALSAYAIYLLPVQWHKYMLYGDPISPFLEKYRLHPDITVIRFAAYLKEYAYSPIGFFPGNLLIPFSPVYITTVLGLGPFLLLLGIAPLKSNRSARVLIMGGAFVIISVVWLGQVTPRFFLEPFFWAIPTLGLAAWGWTKKYFFRILIGQTILVTVILGYGVAALFPGALSAGLRQQVLAKYAHGYALSRWLDQVLPKDAVVIGGLNSGASFSPRPFVDTDIWNFSDLKDPVELKHFLSIVKSFQANIMVVNLPLEEETKNLQPYLGRCLAGPREFELVARNPFQRLGSEEVAVYALNLDSLAVANSMGQARP